MTSDDFRPYLNLLSENPWIQAAAALLISMVVAWLTDLTITRLIRRITRRTRTELDDKVIRLLHRPVFVTVVTIGLVVAVELVIPEEWDWIGFGVLVTVVAFTWLLFLVRVWSLLIQAMAVQEERFQFLQPSTAPLFDIGAKVVFTAIAGYLILKAWHLDVSGLLASAGIIGLALGLAAKDTLSNLFAGVSILADAPYKIGDYIVLDNTERGRVTRIGLRSTRILTRDDIEVTVPNSIISQTKIINESGGPSPRHRIRLPIGVAYGSDPDQLTEIVLKIVSENKLISTDPRPWVQFKGFGDSSLDFELRCWIDFPEVRGRVIDALHRRIYKSLQEAGIEIPFPKRDLYIKEVPDALIGRVQGQDRK